MIPEVPPNLRFSDSVILGLAFLSRGTMLQMLLPGDIMLEGAESDAGEAEHSLS